MFQKISNSIMWLIGLLAIGLVIKLKLVLEFIASLSLGAAVLGIVFCFIVGLGINAQRKKRKIGG